MLLRDFMVTRVVEVAVHGLDLAAALDRSPWLTPEAAAELTGLLLPDPSAGLGGLDVVTFVRAATGRGLLSLPARDVLEKSGPRRLALG